MPSISSIKQHSAIAHVHSAKKHLHDRASRIKSHILGVPDYLRDSWIKRIQHRATAAPMAPASVFEQEKLLIESLFGNSDDPVQSKIYQFYKALKSNTKGTLSQANTVVLAPIDAFKEQIGQIVFLAEKDSNAAAALLDAGNISGSLKKVQSAFDAEVSKLLSNIISQCTTHDKVGLQASKYVASVQKSRAIASLLMTSSGYLNLGLNSAIKAKFFNGAKPLFQYEKDLIDTLDVLERSPDLQDQLRNVSKPADPTLVSNDLIRITLGLPNNCEVTDQNARYVALAALLADMRQGDVGSCFATSVSIMMMGALKGKVISDFAAILAQGKLTRASSTDQSEFIPVLDIGDGTIHNSFDVNHSGKIRSSGAYLWDSPGIVSACRQLGIQASDVEKSIRDAIAAEYEEQGLATTKNLEISVNWLVGKLTDLKFGTGLTPLQKDDITSLALVAFCSETNTPLLRAWESCLAAMAEANSGGMVRGRIIECVSAPFANLMPKSTYSSKLTSTAQKVQDVFNDVVNRSIQLRYDEQVEVDVQEASGDGHSISGLGAFVLHELKPGEKAASARKITTPEEFHGFVKNRFSAVSDNLKGISSSSSQQNDYKSILDKVQQYVFKGGTGASSYLYNSLRAYDDSNSTLAYDLSNWNQLEHLPFRDATGDDNRAVFSKATGFDTSNSTSVRPRNAADLLEAFIAFGKKRAVQDKFLTDNDPYQRYMVDTPQHAFTLTPEDISVVGAMKEGVTASEWIRVNIVRPGVSVSNLSLSASQKTAYAEQVEAYLIPKELRTAFRNGVKKISSKSNSVNAYSIELVNVIQNITGKKDTATKTAITNSLTSVLISSVLPESAKRILSSTAARIADTNWVDDGEKHIYFACFFDPVTNSIQLATMNEDGSGLRPQDQAEWVTYVPWEMYGVKLEPALSKTKATKISLAG